MIIIKNARIITENMDRVGDVTIADDGTLLSLEKNDLPGIDGTGQIVMPGFVDVHAHVRDPGQTHKEDIQTAGKAAARGGYTHVVAMANTTPAIDDVKLYLRNQKKMDESDIHLYQAAAISKGLEGRELTDMKALREAGVLLFTDDGKPLLDEALVKNAMHMAKQLQVPLSFHEEDPRYIGLAGIDDDLAQTLCNCHGANRQAEITMIARDLRLAKETGCTVNFQHISAKESIDLIREAKKQGLDVHAEATPHHFSLNDSAVSIYGTYAKMNPPLRTEEDRIAILEGLRDGTLDIIATDHAPHHKDEKNQPFAKAPSGIIGLESAFALANTHLVKKHILSMSQLVSKMALNPAKMLGIKVGLMLQEEANLVMVDPERIWHYETAASKARNSPFEHHELTGMVTLTVAKGKIVYKAE